MNESKLRDQVQQVAQSLFDINGNVSASELVEAARPKESPCHAAFEWDNNKAGDEYRLIQARKWLRVVVIRTETESEPERLVHVSASQGEGAYKPASAIVKNIDEFTRALDEAMERLNAARRAVDELMAVSQKSKKPDRIAMVMQVSRGLDIMRQAIQSVH